MGAMFAWRVDGISINQVTSEPDRVLIWRASVACIADLLVKVSTSLIIACGIRFADKTLTLGIFFMAVPIASISR